MRDVIEFENDVTPDDSRYLLLSNNGTTTFFQFPGSTTKYEFNSGTQLLIFSGAFLFFGFALFTLYHAAYYGENPPVSGRKRRSLRNEPGDELSSNFEDVPTDFTALYAIDSNWCALRLACELAARSSNSLSTDQKNLMKYFRSVVTQKDLRSMDTPELYYKYASYMGFTSGDVRKCTQHYSKCPFSSAEMIRIYTTGKDDDMDIRTNEIFDRGTNGQQTAATNFGRTSINQLGDKNFRVNNNLNQNNQNFRVNNNVNQNNQNFRVNNNVNQNNQNFRANNNLNQNNQNFRANNNLNQNNQNFRVNNNLNQNNQNFRASNNLNPNNQNFGVNNNANQNNQNLGANNNQHQSIRIFRDNNNLFNQQFAKNSINTLPNIQNGGKGFDSIIVHDMGFTRQYLEERNSTEVVKPTNSLLINANTKPKANELLSETTKKSLSIDPKETSSYTSYKKEPNLFEVKTKLNVSPNKPKTMSVWRSYPNFRNVAKGQPEQEAPVVDGKLKNLPDMSMKTKSTKLSDRNERIKYLLDRRNEILQKKRLKIIKED